MADDVGDQIAIELASNLTELLDLPAAMRFRTPVEVTKEAGLVVSTYHGGDTETVRDRAANEIEYTIVVAVQKKLINKELSEQTTECLALLKHCTEIKKLFRGSGALRETRLAGCAYSGTEHSPRWDDDHLERLAQFTSMILITFKGWS